MEMAAAEVVSVSVGNDQNGDGQKYAANPVRHSQLITTTNGCPVSALPADGTYPSGTTRYEKRNISDVVAEWDAEAQALHWRLRGQLPDGTPVTEQAMVFAHGLRVFQATVVGPQADDALARSFFEKIEVRP